MNGTSYTDAKTHLNRGVKLKDIVLVSENKNLKMVRHLFPSISKIGHIAAVSWFESDA